MPSRSRPKKNRLPLSSVTVAFQVCGRINRANHPIDRSARELMATPPAWRADFTGATDDLFCQKCLANANTTSTTTMRMTIRCSRFVSSKIFRISPCLSAAPGGFDRNPRGFTGHIAHPIRSIRQGYGVTGRTYWIGSLTPASSKPFFRNRQESHSPQARPSGSGS